jgi:hypothetical protein
MPASPESRAPAPKAEPSRKRAPNRFTERELQRICRAINGLDANERERIKRVEIEPTTGRYAIIFGKRDGDDESEHDIMSKL